MLGTAQTNAGVSIWGSGGSHINTSRKGTYFWGELPAANNSAPVLAYLTNIAFASTGPNSEVVDRVVRTNFVPRTPESFLHDLDGNLKEDGRWSYTWDAENRLTKMESLTNAPAASKRRVEFVYDFLGRRIWKKVTNLDTSVVESETRFLYDGWNLIAELNTGGTPVRRYAWGKDLSGTEQGAGGVGGLLKVHSASLVSHFCAYDGNRNIVGLAKSDGSFSAQYEYGPFGEVLRATGPMAKANPFRFSTKYQDDETDLLYCGFRYLSNGRWLSRDPVEERGGLNLYSFAGNNPVTSFDALGQTGLTYYQGTVIPGNCGQFSSWITWSLDNNRSSSDATSGGIIVQQVSVSFNVRLCDKASSPFHFGPPSDMRIDPGAWPLYEAWVIPPGASHPTRSGSPAVDDIFAMPNFGVGTRGSITISATADYFDGQAMPWNFRPTYAPPTHSLPTSRSFSPPGPPTSTVARTVTVTWDCCCRTEKSQVSTQ